MSKHTITVTDKKTGKVIELPVPNIDFYSGLIYRALCIPANMFTVMFAIARTVGWVAQWMEMIGDENLRIGRPRQLYVGPPKRDYVDINYR